MAWAAARGRRGRWWCGGECQRFYLFCGSGGAFRFALWHMHVSEPGRALLAPCPPVPGLLGLTHWHLEMTAYLPGGRGPPALLPFDSCCSRKPCPVSPSLPPSGWRLRVVVHVRQLPGHRPVARRPLHRHVAAAGGLGELQAVGAGGQLHRRAVHAGGWVGVRGGARTGRLGVRGRGAGQRKIWGSHDSSALGSCESVACVWRRRAAGACGPPWRVAAHQDTGMSGAPARSCPACCSYTPAPVRAACLARPYPSTFLSLALAPS